MQITLNKVPFDVAPVEGRLRAALLADPLIASGVGREVWAWDGAEGRFLVPVTQTQGLPLPTGLIVFVPRAGTNGGPLQKAEGPTRKMAERFMAAVGAKSFAAGHAGPRPRHRHPAEDGPLRGLRGAEGPRPLPHPHGDRVRRPLARQRRAQPAGLHVRPRPRRLPPRRRRGARGRARPGLDPAGLRHPAAEPGRPRAAPHGRGPAPDRDAGRPRRDQARRPPRGRPPPRSRSPSSAPSGASCRPGPQATRAA